MQVLFSCLNLAFLLHTCTKTPKFHTHTLNQGETQFWWKLKLFWISPSEFLLNQVNSHITKSLFIFVSNHKVNWCCFFLLNFHNNIGLMDYENIWKSLKWIQWIWNHQKASLNVYNACFHYLINPLKTFQKNSKTYL